MASRGKNEKQRYLPKDADLARDPESDGDSGVDVSAADVRKNPDNRCDTETEWQRNPNYVTRDARATTDQHE